MDYILKKMLARRDVRQAFSFIFNIFSDSKFSQQNVPNSNDMAD